METRDGHGVEVRHAPDVVTSAPPVVLPERPSGVDDSPAGAVPSRRRLLGLLTVALVTALVLTLALALWVGGDDDVVARAPGYSVEKPTGPAPLGMSVDVPSPVVAGEEATLTVRWTDGSGIFSGTSEEWGDGVGTSSLEQGRCEQGAGAAGASGGTYDVTHTWSEPGRYTVVMGVATYTCDGGSASEEQVSRTLTVEVRPAG